MVLIITFAFELNLLKIKFSFFSVNGLLIKFCEYFPIRLLFIFKEYVEVNCAFITFMKTHWILHYLQYISLPLLVLVAYQLNFLRNFGDARE